MLAGEMGPARAWALDHQLRVARMFDAADLVPVNQVHIMADPEAVGDAGVAFLEDLVARNARVAVPTITDPRGVDLNHYGPLGQTEEMAALERRLIGAGLALGMLMTNTCVNYQTIMAPVFGDHVAFGDTGVVVYCNSVCGARTNFEGGPSALAAALTGRTPRYGLHLDENRLGTRRFRVDHQPDGLLDWGLLGAEVGRRSGSYWAVPVIEGLERVPSSDELKHMGAAMASFGSTPLFHLVGITPEARTLGDVEAEHLESEPIDADAVNRLRSRFGARGDAVDVVVFAAPQLSLIELQAVAGQIDGRRLRVPLFVCTSPQVYADATRHGYVATIENAGGKVLEGTCFYNQYAREIGEHNGWRRLLSNSVKIVNILGGYGYQPALASMEACIESAIAGEIVA